MTLDSAVLILRDVAYFIGAAIIASLFFKTFFRKEPRGRKPYELPEDLGD